MMEDEHIWKYLLVGMGRAEKQASWPERKTALEKVITEFPNSRWSDDAALILAIGIYEFEGKTGLDELKSTLEARDQGYFGDAEKAIGELNTIVEKYPNEKTILSPWLVPGCGPQLDNHWMMARASLPFDKHGKFSQQDREYLVYFDHLEKFPVYTKDVAKLYIAGLLTFQKDDMPSSIEVLEEILSDTVEFKLAVIADKSRALEEYAHLIRIGIERPQYIAYRGLITLYRAQGRKEEMVSLTQSFAEIVNQGINVPIIEEVGKVYDELGLTNKAKQQYQSALDTLEIVIDLDKQRKVRLGHAVMTDSDLLKKKAELELLINKD